MTMGKRRRKTWGAYSSESSKKICMHWGVVAEVVSFSIDVVRGGEEGEAEY